MTEESALEPVLLVRRDGPVLRLMLNRPRLGNSLDPALAQQLTQAFETVESSVAVVVLSGNGKLFCAGGDVGAFSRAADPGGFLAELAVDAHRAILAIEQCPVPVVAAVHGNVAGAGLGLIAACDVVIAARAARFRPAYVSLGLTPDAGLTWRLSRQLGTARALDLLLTDGELDSAEALSAGIITRIADDLDADVAAVVDALSHGPAAAYGQIKRLVHQAPERSIESQLEVEAASISLAADSADGREGVAAFMAKRPPQFALPE